MALSPQTLAAIQKYGPQVDDIAKQYDISGTALLGKLVWGESRDRGNAVSPVGAKGWTQFMPGSRQDLLTKFGVDPWADVDQAVHGAVLHLQGKVNGKTGLAGYNPGSSTYTDYILGQKVGNVLGQGSASPPMRPGSPASAAGPASRVPAAPTAPGLLDGGQSGDFTGVLSALLGQGQEAPAPRSTLAPIGGAAKMALPTGFRPLESSSGAPQAPGQEQGVSQALGLLEALRGSAPASGASPGDQASDGPQTAADPYASVAAQRKAGVNSGNYNEFKARADLIDAAKMPYKWGGGHAGKVNVNKSLVPLDCSGAVSAVLGIDPRVSGQFTAWGQRGDGGNKGITVYANDEHVLMKIDGHFFGTSASNPGGGAGWIEQRAISKNYLKGFTARHL